MSGSDRTSSRRRRWWGRLPLLLVCGLSACRSVAPLPKVDLGEPGWTIHRGQAVWRADSRAPEIAGEILLATNREGRAFVQFTKSPFPFVVAQSTPDAWQIELPARNRRYSGRGAPPGRLLWLQLPRALAGSGLPQNWSWRSAARDWRLENLANGEWLEGYFAP